MKKVVYLEGITELVFVYRLICTHYDYDVTRVQVHCINLDPNSKFELPAHYGIQEAPDYFQLICASGDSGVISQMRERYEGHIEAGYEVVVGLKDVFGKEYTQLAGHKLDTEKVKRIISIQHRVFAEESRVKLCFAIMEVEAWVLGMTGFLSREYPQMKLNNEVDPEMTYVHPYKDIHMAFSSIGVPFEKHWGDIISVFNRIQKADFDQLYASDYCASFNSFFDVLLGIAKEDMIA